MKFETIASDAKETPRFVPLEKSLKPLLISMKIAAVYFDPTPAKKSDETSDDERKSSWLAAVLTCRVYCWCILLVMWFNFIRFVAGLFPSDEGLSFRIILVTWSLQCTLNSTIMVVSCCRLKFLRSFYQHWDRLFKDDITVTLGCGFRCPLKYLKIATAAGWTIFVGNTVATGILLFADVSKSRYVVVNMVRPFPENQLVLVLGYIMQMFASGAWVFPVLFVNVISRLIQAQFLQFGRSLSKQIDKAHGSIPDCLPEFRCRYTQLCHAVKIINGAFKWLLGISFFVQVFMACFISYQIVNSPPEIFSTAINVFWLCSCFLIIFILSCGSSDVHDSAHSLLEDVFRMGSKNATPEQLGQLHLFLTKLTGTSVGFTAINFFVVTKEFLLTVGTLIFFPISSKHKIDVKLGGLYITYFFLLLQFKIA